MIKNFCEIFVKNFIAIEMQFYKICYCNRLFICIKNKKREKDLIKLNVLKFKKYVLTATTNKLYIVKLLVKKMYSKFGIHKCYVSRVKNNIANYKAIF